jgi:fibronectin-binding autotransporter adhesin
MHRPVHSRVLRKTAASLLAIAALSGQSYSQLLTIGVNFLGRDGGGGGTNADFQLGIDDLAGVVPQRDWNNLGNNVVGMPSGNFSLTPINATSGALFADDGLLGSRLTSNVTVSVTASDSWNSDGATTTPDQKLMKGIIKANTANPQVSVVLNNLTPGTRFKFLAYSQENGGTGDVDFTLAGTATYDTYFVRQSNNFDGTFTQGTSTNSAARTAGVDYVQWDTVMADATGKLTLTMFYRGNGSDGAGLAGFQLLELAPLGVDKFYKFGPGAGTFDTTTQNWSLDAGGVNAALFAANDNPIFGDIGGAGARNVTVAAGGVDIGQMVVNNAAGNDYTIGGAPIRGIAGSLTKDGAGSLTLTGANEFIGGTTIKHGTVNVSTIGDATTAGNLGQGPSLTLGDTVAGAPAVLNYTGATATVQRAVAIAQTGGAINVPAGTVLTLGNVTGTGDFTKGGVGDIVFSGTAGNLSGGIAVPQGTLTIGSMGRGTTSLSIGTSGVAAFNYGGNSLNDGRSVTTGANASTIIVANAATRYQVNNFTPGAGPVTIAGAGRFAIAGVANLAGGLPTIAPGATLALQNESTTTPNVVPAGNINIAANTTLEIAPGALGANTTGTIVLNGGTVRLAHEGLQGNYYAGGIGNAQGDLSGTSQSVANYFSGLTPAVTARTNTGGRTDLGFGDVGAGAPFASQGFADVDQVRAYFTGKILITNPGDTTFFTTSDDGSVVFINGQRVVNNNFNQGFTNSTRQGTVNLAAGLHDIQVFYFEGGGGAGLNVEYTPAGGVRQFVPNSVLFAGDTYTDARPINVTANSALETGGRANLGALTQTAGTVLTVSGSAVFASTAVTGASPTFGTNVANRDGFVNLGPITATTPTINKTGPGALVFSSAAPNGSTVNSNAGLVVLQGSEAGGVTVNPLTGSTLNFTGGGLGLSATAGNPVYNVPLTPAGDFRIEAGRFGSALTAPTNITLQNAGIAIAGTSTLFTRALESNVTLSVNAPITGTGTLLAEEGRVDFTGASLAPGAFTVGVARVNVSGPITTGALTVANSLGGVVPTGPNNTAQLTANGTVAASSVTVNGGSLTIAGALTNTGALNIAGGTTTLQSNATSASVTVGTGTLNANANLTSAGALTVNGGGVATVGGVTTVASIGLNGNGRLTVAGNVASPGGTTLASGTTLTLNNGASATYSGGITANEATVRAQAGTTDLGSGALSFSTYTVQAGLLEGFINSGDIGGVALTTPNTGASRPGSADTGGIRLFPRLGQTNAVNADNWGDNMTWVYTGQFFDADGTFTFGENIDDDTRLFIDGALVLNSGCCGEARSNNGGANDGNSYGMGPNGDGWHNFEVRFRNGGGGAGSAPTGANWGQGDAATYSRIGFGLNANGTTSVDRIAGGYVIPTDPGNASLFRVATGGGSLDVDAGATLKVGSTSNASNIRLNGGAGSPAVLEINDNATATASTANVIRVNGTSAEARVRVGTNNTFTVGGINLADGAQFTKTGLGTLRVTGEVEENVSGLASSVFGTGQVEVTQGMLIMNAATTGTGGITASGTGVLGGVGSIQGPVSVLTGATLAPGDVGIGELSTGALTLNSGSTLQLQLTSQAVLDQLDVTGSVALGNPNLALQLVGFNGALNDVLYIILNDSTDAITGTFNGIANLGTIPGTGGYEFQINYAANSADGAAGFTTPGNDVALRVSTVPEPSTAVALLSGIGALLGLQRFRRRQA